MMNRDFRAPQGVRCGFDQSLIRRSLYVLPHASRLPMVVS